MYGGNSAKWALALLLVVALAVAGIAGSLPASGAAMLSPLPFPGASEGTASGDAGESPAPGGYRLAAAGPPAGGPVDFRHYPTAAEIEEFCAALELSYPEIVRLTEVGRSYQGRPILLLRLGSDAGGGPDTRPALLLEGQHHAREPIGQQAALYTAWHLASTYGTDPLSTHLLDTRTLYVLPCVNPDGNEVFLNQYYAQRKNLRPTDDDGDGLEDEDPYDGVCGWHVAEALELAFTPSWVDAHLGDPFARGWEYHLTRRRSLGFYDLETSSWVPQLDCDGDGRVNEDISGGVDLNRNYTAGWDYCSNQPASLVYRGTEPFSEPETRAVRDAVTARPNIRLAVSYHSGDDRLAISGIAGPRLTRDAPLFERVGIKASQLTESHGYEGTRHEYGSGMAPGETRTWLYERGILAWLVEAYVDPRPVRWTWSDEAAGRVIAYFHTGLRFNPSPEGILDACRRWLGFNLYLLAAVPCPRPGAPILADGLLEVPLFNDGLVPVEVCVEARVGEAILGHRVLGRTGASGWVVSFPVDGATVAALGQKEGPELVLTVTAGAPGLEYRLPEMTSVYEYRWKPVAGDDPPGCCGLPSALAGPPPGDFLCLGAAFGPGGWDADPQRWDTERYHMSRYIRPVQVVP